MDSVGNMSKEDSAKLRYGRHCCEATYALHYFLTKIGGLVNGDVEVEANGLVDMANTISYCC